MPEQIGELKDRLRKYEYEGADEYDNDRLRDLTPEQIDVWIDSNVVDLSSAKVALKKIGRAIIFLYKIMEVEVSG